MDRKSMDKKMRIYAALLIGAFLVLITRLFKPPEADCDHRSKG